MKKLNNAILNNIVEKFVKRKEYKERKTLNWLKFIPFPAFCIPIIGAYALLKNKSMKKNITDYIVSTFFVIPIFYVMYNILSFIPTFIVLVSLSVICKLNISDSQVFYILGIFMLIFDLIFCNFLIKEDKLYTIDMDKELHEEKVFSEMLTKEDFELIMKNFDDRIIKKAINDNKKDGLSYGDLSHLDELLRNKQKTLDEINKREFEEVFASIDKNDLVKGLKGKNKIEMIQYFENLGIEINNKNKIINEEEHGFYSKIIPINNKDSTKAILKEEKNSFSARIIKNEKREEIIK